MRDSNISLRHYFETGSEALPDQAGRFSFVHQLLQKTQCQICILCLCCVVFQRKQNIFEKLTYIFEHFGFVFGGPGFKSRPRDGLSRLRFFLSPVGNAGIVT
jgi:hypothetical protein